MPIKIFKYSLCVLIAVLLLIVASIGFNLYIIDKAESFSYLNELSISAQQKAAKADQAVIQGDVSKLNGLKLISSRPEMVELKMIINFAHKTPGFIAPEALEALIGKVEDEDVRAFFATQALGLLPKNAVHHYFRRAVTVAHERNAREKKLNHFVLKVVDQLRKFTNSSREALLLSELFGIPNSERANNIDLFSRYNEFVEQAIWQGNLDELSQMIDQYAQIGPLERQSIYVWMARNKDLSGVRLLDLVAYTAKMSKRELQCSIFPSLLLFNKHLTHSMFKDILQSGILDREIIWLFIRAVVESPVMNEDEKNQLLIQLIEHHHLSKPMLDNLFVITQAHKWQALQDRIVNLQQIYI